MQQYQSNLYHRNTLFNLNYIFKSISETLTMNYSRFLSRSRAGAIQHNNKFYFVKRVYVRRAVMYVKWRAYHCSPIYDGYQTVHKASLTANSEGTSAQKFVKIRSSPSWSRNFQPYKNFEISPLFTRACISSCSQLDASIAHPPTPSDTH
jgi:hypothetical protein